MKAALSEDAATAWLLLARARPDPAAVLALLERHGSAEEIVSLPDAELLRAGLGEQSRRALLDPDRRAIERDLEWWSEEGTALVPVGSADYPALLAGIDSPPILLYIRGDVEALHLPCLAIVGSRNPTRGGVRNAFEFSRHLAASGFCIVSGLASGIDTAAHRGALEGGGRTVAFLGHGIDRVYPSANRELAHRIAAAGALVTELPPGTAPRREHFPQRNRLISGSSLGTLVVEAARRSGSLITARLAGEQGREVFAVPGSIHNALSRGCHQLIRQGAKLVECADDIVGELGALAGGLLEGETVSEAPGIAAPQRDAEYEALLDALGHDPATPNDLATASGLTIEQVSSMLLILELEGEVEALNGGQYSRVRSSSRDERKRARRADVPF